MADSVRCRCRRQLSRCLQLDARRQQDRQRSQQRVACTGRVHNGHRQPTRADGLIFADRSHQPHIRTQPRGGHRGVPALSPAATTLSTAVTEPSAAGRAIPFRGRDTQHQLRVSIKANEWVAQSRPRRAQTAIQMSHSGFSRAGPPVKSVLRLLDQQPLARAPLGRRQDGSDQDPRKRGAADARANLPLAAIDHRCRAVTAGSDLDRGVAELGNASQS